MGKVSFNISMSLDGFINGPDVTAEEGLGKGGERLHDWAFKGDERNREVLASAHELGAIIAGRRTYDLSVPWWGADGPTGGLRVPVFVVTHSVPDDVPDGGVYTFVTNGIEEALERAKAAAGDKGVSVMGGASTGRQYLAAGLLDEIAIHLVPVLLGGGTRMFADGEEQRQLELVDVVDTPLATHLRYRVLAETAVEV